MGSDPNCEAAQQEGAAIIFYYPMVSFFERILCVVSWEIRIFALETDKTDR